MTLTGLLSLPFASMAMADDVVSLPTATCTTPQSRVRNTLYEFDKNGKSVEWNYPSGLPVVNGLSLKGLGLQKSNSKKDTSDIGLRDLDNLASRFIDHHEELDWHPTTLWSAQFVAKAIIALEEDEDKIGTAPISDDYFAYQRVGGVNPVMLKKVGNDPTFRAFMQAGKDYYMVDYQALNTLRENNHVSEANLNARGQTQRYGYQPKALFVVEGRKLKTVAIQIRRGNNSAFVKPGDPKWEIAKYIVQNADINYHQLATHLGATHLFVEPFAVSAGMCLSRYEHPISVLLRPHFEGTLNINDFSTTDLINISPQSEHGGVFDLNFTGTMASNVQFLAEEVFGLYDANRLRRDPALAHRVANLFNERSFPKDITDRGVGHFKMEKIKVDSKATSREIDIFVTHVRPGARGTNGIGFDYPYLEDSCLLWNALTDWVCRYVDVYYKNDAAVRNDCELQTWAKTVSTDGKIKGFGEIINGKILPGQILSRLYLVQALTVVIFTASIQHAAVNFSQSDFGATLPAGIYHDFFADNDTDVSKYLPNEAHFKEVMDTLSILAASQYTELGKYHNNTSTDKKLRSVTDYFENDDVQRHLKQFQKTLKSIEAVLKKRRRNEHGHKYDYLVPSKIPQSTNV
jgi:arachidonate 15-lipoxygenase